MKPIEDRIADALPTVEQIIRRLDPGLLIVTFGHADRLSRAEGEQGGPASNIDSDPAPESDRGSPVQHRQQRDEAEQPLVGGHHDHHGWLR